MYTLLKTTLLYKLQFRRKIIFFQTSLITKGLVKELEHKDTNQLRKIISSFKSKGIIKGPFLVNSQLPLRTESQKTKRQFNLNKITTWWKHVRQWTELFPANAYSNTKGKNVTFWLVFREMCSLCSGPSRDYHLMDYPPQINLQFRRFIKVTDD